MTDVARYDALYRPSLGAPRGVAHLCKPYSIDTTIRRRLYPARLLKAYKFRDFRECQSARACSRPPGSPLLERKTILVCEQARTVGFATVPPAMYGLTTRIEVFIWLHDKLVCRNGWRYPSSAAERRMLVSVALGQCRGCRLHPLIFWSCRPGPWTPSNVNEREARSHGENAISSSDLALTKGAES